MEHGGHELLPAADVQDLVRSFFAGEPVADTTVRWPAPRFLTVEQALEPPRRPGG